ncbi:MAG: hypothetical protein E5V62_26990, partial [Mesorhizobium sp.]
MVRRIALALATISMLATGLSVSAQGLFGAPPANAPADNAPSDDTSPAPPAAASPPAESAPAAPVLPGSPTAVVKPFYEHLGLELDPAERKNFIDPARTVLDKSDALRKSGQG